MDQYFLFKKEELTEEILESKDLGNGVLIAECGCCHKNVGVYALDEEEAEAVVFYEFLGRSMGSIQDVFPKIPAWIHAGAIDQYSAGFCVCPECCEANAEPEEDEDEEKYKETSSYFC